MKVNIIQADDPDCHSVKMESDEKRPGHIQSPQWVAEMILPAKDLIDLHNALGEYIEEQAALESGTSSADDITGGFDSGS